MFHVFHIFHASSLLRCAFYELKSFKFYLLLDSYIELKNLVNPMFLYSSHFHNGENKFLNFYYFSH